MEDDPATMSARRLASYPFVLVAAATLLGCLNAGGPGGSDSADASSSGSDSSGGHGCGDGTCDPGEE